MLMADLEGTVKRWREVRKRDVEAQVRFTAEHVLNNVGHDGGDKTSPVSQDVPVSICHPD